MSNSPRVALAGNPNVGKTSLFNALTGARHKVGNYAGVTVETRTGVVTTPGGSVTLLDLPGTYSLTPVAEDEAVAYRCLAGTEASPPDAVLLVVDAANLGRNLYLVMQLIELGLPVCVALNMMDVAREAGLEVDAAALANNLGIPVIPTIARTGEGIPQLLQALDDVRTWPTTEGPRRVRLLSRDGCEATALDEPAGPVRSRWLQAAHAADTTAFLNCTSNEREALRAVEPSIAEANTALWVERRYAEVDAVL
ncbi:MAG: FeoB small GTPase domain-containing protein, partial [Nannocystaceae bacterium]